MSRHPSSDSSTPATPASGPTAPSSSARLFQRGLVFGAMLAALAAATLMTGHSTALASPNGLVINEIYDSQNGANEYFELYNNSAVPINLSTYTIWNKDTSIPLSRLSDPVIAAGQFRAIGSAQVGTWFTGTTGISRTDFLALTTSSPTDTVIDVVNFGGSPNPNWANYQRFSQYFFIANIPQLAPEDGTTSLQRWPDGLDTDQGSDWAILISSPGSASCGDPYESDNTLATAKTQSPGTSLLHRICPAGDQDWASVPMATANVYTIRAAAQGQSVDTVMSLYDSTGALIQTSDDPGSRDSSITYRPTSSGTYYVQITDKNNAGGTGTNFLYTLTITAQPAATATPVVSGTPATPTATPGLDPYEPDNTMAQAKPIDLNIEQRHTLDPVGDVDWVVFGATTNKVYSLYTRDLSAPVDTIIDLYDRRGNLLAENDDYAPGQGLYSRIDYVFGSTSIYYLKIRDKRGSGGPGYGYTVGVSSQGGSPPTSTPSPSPTLNPFSPTPTSAPCYDSFEADGLPQDAKVILIGETQHHSICPAGDADWVKFYARAGKVYTIRTANLGVGLDTYMYLFDNDTRTILAQNDDGGEGVASRIDFYPLRDNWYYAQVKNAGDLGGPQMTYDLSLAVVPGVPQPPSTPTGIIAPPVTVTTAPQGSPTNQPANTPTQAGISPTPAVENPPPVPTQAGIPGPVGTAGVDQSQPQATPYIPGVPNTGAEGAAPPAPPAPPAPQSSGGRVGLANLPLTFNLFYDRNNNGAFDVGESIRGIKVYFLRSDSGVAGSFTTSGLGSVTLKLPPVRQRVYIPYLGINADVDAFPGRDALSLFLPPVQLPNRVP